ncbi:MAG TPA: M23 family metallopeptidase [Salinimicrobium sp.]|nr:M23 family metallopeptidase [Salinimicrobium sp.]
MKNIFVPLVFLISLRVLAQEEIPTDYFKDPLDIDIVLAGSFGELRSNHFHAGLDIKTEQQTGKDVHASAEGYVSRINVSPYGYGKALYIQHPNGYTTVYGHLQRFSPKIEAYIKERQYKAESYDIEVYPTAEELPVEQGEMIAKSGNTGGSGGPHLHFEIRDGQQRPMNPLMFGIEVEDSRLPIVDGLYVYPLGENAHVNNSQERQKLSLVLQKDGSYKAEKITACGEIAFGVSTVDHFDKAANRNGVFQIETSLNGEQIFQAKFDKFSFAETRYLNQLLDYEQYQKTNQRIQKLYVEANNPLSIYDDLRNYGILNVKDSLSYNYTISITDFAGNERLIQVPIEGKFSYNIKPKKGKITDFFVDADEATMFEGNGIDVYIPKNSLYRDTYLDVSFEEEKVHLHEDIVPIHQSITIGFNVSKYKPEDREQMYIARLSAYGTPYYSDTEKEGDRFITRTRTFGVYTLARDTNPPRIVPVNFRDGQWISGNETLKVRISDDLTGISDYHATVNGKFILMEFEYKDNMLTHYFSDDVVTDTENHLKITVTDNVGNTAVYEGTFFRKE